MNAMLALGAAELHADHPDDGISTDILKHRGRAISGLQKAMNDTASWYICGYPDAILATCYILVSQCSHMRDATDDFNIAVRGCALVTEKLCRDQIKTSFQLLPEDLYELIRVGLRNANHRVAKLPSLEPALRALIDLDEHIGSSRAKPFADALAQNLMQFSESPSETYIESLKNFGSWYHLALGVIDSLRDPQEAPFVVILETLLLANMVWLKLLVPLIIWPRPHNKPSSNPLPKKALVEIAHWVEAIGHYLPHEYQRFMEFPLSVVGAIPWKTLEIIRPSNKDTAASVASKVDILQSIDGQAHTMLGRFLRLTSELASWFAGYIVANTTSRPQELATNRKPMPVPMPLGG